MTKLKLYYGGWLALPADLRRTLGVGTGDRLEVELVDDMLRLRPGARAKALPGNEPEATAIEPAVGTTASAPSPSASTSAKRPSQRPPQVAVAEPPEPATTPERPLARLRKAEPKPTPEPKTSTGEGPRSELWRKVALPVLREEVAVRGRVRAWVTPSTGHEREERRPFPHVEVRKLGPDRRRNRSRGPQL